MTTILAKEEDDIKKATARTVSVITYPDSGSQKRKTPPKNSGDNRPFKKKNFGTKKSGQNRASSSNEANSGGFKGKCNFCYKFRYRKVDYHKLKTYLRK